MAKSVKSVLKSYGKQYRKIQNTARKQAGLPPLRKKANYYDKYHQPPKPPKRAKAVKPLTKAQIKDLEKRQNNNGCYIATCVYGSYDCPEVWTLRRFRDYTLAATWYGRLFIKGYYAISPILVHHFGNIGWLRRRWKSRLDAWVSRLNEGGVDSTEYHDKF